MIQIDKTDVQFADRQSNHIGVMHFLQRILFHDQNKRKEMRKRITRSTLKKNKKSYKTSSQARGGQKKGNDY